MEQRLEITKYAVLELNNVAFRRDGRIEAQCELDSTDFATKPLENGMIVSVDKANNKITLPDDDLPVGLSYATEHIYDSYTPGLNNFATTIDGFLPRIGYLAIGDIFTTNCLAYDDTELADDAAVKTAVKSYKTTAVYGTTSDSGAILLTKTKPTSGVVLKVVEDTTIPNGDFGVKLQVLAV